MATLKLGDASAAPTARRICSAPESQGMVLIALTGYGLPEDRRKAERAGFDARLVKPINIERLDELPASRRRARQ